MIDTTKTPTVPLLCRLNVHHHWHAESTEDGQRYYRCSRCGKDASSVSRGLFESFRDPTRR